MVSFFRRILPARWFASDPLPPADPVQAAPAVPQPLPGPGVPPWRTGRWSTEVLANMQERQFQALCKALFAPVGAEVQALPRQPGGVLDLRLYSQRERTPMTVVRCMHHPGSPVDVPELREFLQEIAQQRLRHGTFATSSSFTPEALDFASDSGFSALDGDSLLAMIERRTPQQQRALLAAACEPER